MHECTLRYTHKQQAHICVHASPEIGFLSLLSKVKTDELAAQEEGYCCATNGVNQQRHEQRGVDLRATTELRYKTTQQVTLITRQAQ